MADILGIPVGEWLDFMSDTVTITPWTAWDGQGKSVFGGTPVSYPAYIEMKNRLIVDAGGREVIARGRVFMGTTVVPNVKDQITLPADFVPTTPPMLAVNVVSDEAGIHHITIDIG